MKTETIRSAARILLGSALVLAGISHLTFAREEFRAQVPNWVPLKKEDTVIYSGIAEVALGLSLAASPQKLRPVAGMVAAGFFIAVFPGNIAQYTHHRSAFGLDTDTKRIARLFFQPLLVGWAYWSTRRK